MMYAMAMDNITFTVSMPAWYQIVGGICSFVLFFMCGPTVIRCILAGLLFLLKSLWMIAVVDLSAVWHYKRISAVIASILCFPFCLSGFFFSHNMQPAAYISLSLSCVLVAFFIILCIEIPLQNTKGYGHGYKHLRKNYEDAKKGNLFEDNDVPN